MGSGFVGVKRSHLSVADLNLGFHTMRMVPLLIKGCIPYN